MASCSDEPVTPSENENGPTAPEGSYALSQKLFRTYGVGYGYDAMGTYANGKDIKDRILSLPDVMEYEQKNHVSIFVDDISSSVSSTVVSGYDYKEYATALTTRATSDIDYLFFEEHMEETFTSTTLQSNANAFATVFYQYKIGSRHVDPYLLSAIIEENPQLLSRPFREQVAKLTALIKGGGSSMEIYLACKDFIRLYGTHFIYHSDLGGSLEFNTVINKSVLTNTKTLEQAAWSTFASVVTHSETSQEGQIYQEVKNGCSYTISARGGDVDILREFITAPTASGDWDNTIIERWINSISFDRDWNNEGNSEMADFKLFPIVNLITDESVREYLLLTIKTLLDESWDNYKEGNNVLYQSIDVTDIPKYAQIGEVQVLSKSGKEFAEITREHIKTNGKNYDIATIYPIAGGLAVTDGFGVENGKLYNISWRRDECVLTEIGPVSDNNKLYYTNGMLSLSKSNSIEYSDNYDKNKLSFYSWDDYYSGIYKVGPYLLLIGPHAQPRQSYKSDSYDIIMSDKPFGLNIITDKFALNNLSPILKKYESLKDAYTLYDYDYYGLGGDGELTIFRFKSNLVQVVEVPDNWQESHHLLYYRPLDYRY